MGALQAKFIGRYDQIHGNCFLRFRFKFGKQVQEHVHVGLFKIVCGLLHFLAVMYLAIGNRIVPHEIIHIVDPLQIHGYTLQTIGQLNGDRSQFHTPSLLKIRKLCDLHAVKPHFPPQAGRTECGGLPVIFHEPDIMFQRIDAQDLHALQVLLLNIRW